MEGQELSFNRLQDNFTNPEYTVYNHQCYICDKIFSANSNLNRHLRNIHKEEVQSPYNNVKCALCDRFFPSTSIYNSHLGDDHKIVIETEHLTFSEKDAFKSWKLKIENMTTSQFIKSRGVKESEGLRKVYYNCNRSGYYVSKARTMKALKKQGSRKINGRCPASMHITSNTEGAIDVKFIRTHVGHDFNIKHLDLSKEDRNLIVEKLVAGVPKRDIIKHIRNISDNSIFQTPWVVCHNITGTKNVRPASQIIDENLIKNKNNTFDCKAKYQTTSRLHLATTKDIHNIINSLRLNSKAIKHNYDLTNVEIWIDEMKQLNEAGSVLFYKPQEEMIDRFEMLQPDDFMLVIMKDGQSEILKTFGDKCIIMDSNYTSHHEELHMTIVATIDETSKGFPVAFLFSNRIDKRILEVFFTIIRDKVGRISTKMVIADELNDFYEAWTKVMSRPTHNLLSPWAVLDSWLKQVHKIENKDKLKRIKKLMKNLLQESDPQKFNQYKESLGDYNLDSDVSQFIEYFNSEFDINHDLWSNSFRKTHGASNIQLMKLHANFKNVWKRTKNTRKLCRYIASLMDLFEASQLRQLQDTEEKTLARKRAVMTRHENSKTNLVVYEVTEDPTYWLCPCDSANNVYFEVREVGPCTCALKCASCNECRHRYKCSCLDYVINMNMCKHIHRVCQAVL